MDEKRDYPAGFKADLSRVISTTLRSGPYELTVQGEGCGIVACEFAQKESKLHANGHPLFYIIGEQWFKSRGFACRARPRRDTGTNPLMRLVDWIMLALLRWAWRHMTAADRAAKLKEARNEA